MTGNEPKWQRGTGDGAEGQPLAGAWQWKAVS